ncbi:MAG: hypothetical protein JOY71_20815, partial [Acetobacteraceae bacterium]|nr:hypothetical protein [Acetobacteraceae bacterium]MBV8592213.1 hypothetical protein [Acetobacteraceae bacterium]
MPRNRWTGRTIDNAEKTQRLFGSLQAALPVPAQVTPELAAAVANPASEIPRACSITWISYLGDEGGIMCRLDFGRDTENAVLRPLRNYASTRFCRWLARSLL